MFSLDQHSNMKTDVNPRPDLEMISICRGRPLCSNHLTNLLHSFNISILISIISTLSFYKILCNTLRQTKFVIYSCQSSKHITSTPITKELLPTKSWKSIRHLHLGFTNLLLLEVLRTKNAPVLFANVNISHHLCNKLCFAPITKKHSGPFMEKQTTSNTWVMMTTQQLLEPKQFIYTF